MSHTPGPWTKWVGHAEVYAGVGENTPGSIKGKNRKPMPCVARCDDDDDLDEYEQEANAALVAAAPDLLQALKVYLMAGHKEARRKASIMAKAAIAKATRAEE